MKFLITIICALGYIAVIIWSFRYNIIPLLEHYGTLNWIGMNLLFFVLAFACGFIGMIGYQYTPPSKPQATYKETTS